MLHGFLIPPLSMNSGKKANGPIIKVRHQIAGSIPLSRSMHFENTLL
jgi:hypothetical protein